MSNDCWFCSLPIIHGYSTRKKKNCQLNHPEPPKTNKTYHQSILVVLYELYPHEMVTSPICLIVRIMLKNKSAGVLNGIEMVKNVAMYPNKIIMPWNPCFWWLKISFSSLVELQQSSVAPSPAQRGTVLEQMKGSEPGSPWTWRIYNRIKVIKYD